MIEGIVRRMDNLGRVCFPKEARRALGLKENDQVEIYVVDGEFRVNPVRTRCQCCGKSEKETMLIEQNGVVLCEKCVTEFSMDLNKKAGKEINIPNQHLLINY